MKQKDIALILVVSFVSAVFSIFISGVVFNSSSDKKLESDVVNAITSDFITPDRKYFNEQSTNPTQTIRIGENANNQPFNQ